MFKYYAKTKPTGLYNRLVVCLHCKAGLYINPSKTDQWDFCCPECGRIVSS